MSRIAALLGALCIAAALTAHADDSGAVADTGERTEQTEEGGSAGAVAAPRHFLSSGEPAVEWPPLEILDESVPPGERVSLELVLSESFGGTPVTTPVSVTRGTSPGPTLCLTGGVHGDEIVGVEIVRRAIDQVDPAQLRGTLIGVPVVNALGFRRGSRYLPDRRDLNRYFPGRPTGSSAARIAYRLFTRVIKHCEVLVDFHSGSFHRANLPQVRANLEDPRLTGLAGWFGAPVVVHSVGRLGTLRQAANAAGINALLYEAGEPLKFDQGSVAGGVEGSERLMEALGMLDSGLSPVAASDVFRGSHWVRADEGGIFLGERGLGDQVEAGERIGTLTDPFSNEQVEVRSTQGGRVIGRAVDQVVLPGFALYHLGTQRAGEAEPIPAEDSAATAGPEMDERPE